MLSTLNTLSVSPVSRPYFKTTGAETLFSSFAPTVLLSHLQGNYRVLQARLNHPEVIAYDDLVQLRRKVVHHDKVTNNYQARLSLALMLFQLGRRSEGCEVLTRLEELLQAQASSPTQLPVALTYKIWVILLWRALGQSDLAWRNARQLVPLLPNAEAGRALVNFLWECHSSSPYQAW